MLHGSAYSCSTLTLNSRMPLTGNAIYSSRRKVQEKNPAAAYHAAARHQRHTMHRSASVSSGASSFSI